MTQSPRCSQSGDHLQVHARKLQKFVAAHEVHVVVDIEQPVEVHQLDHVVHRRLQRARQLLSGGCYRGG